MEFICKHCGKEYKVGDDEQNTGYCSSCIKLQNEQNKRCAEMFKAFPDEPMDWKSFEEDIMEIDYN